MLLWLHINRETLQMRESHGESPQKSLRNMEGTTRKRRATRVDGELDWSPQVHKQCIGRLNRDAQESPVTAVYLHAAGGSDPVILQTLGVKRAQSEGIINPGLADGGATAPY